MIFSGSSEPVVENPPTQTQTKYVPTSDKSEEAETSLRTEIRISFFFQFLN